MTQPPGPLATPLAWDLVAEDYATEIVPQFEKYAIDALRLAKAAEGDRVLDVAAGPGTLSLLAAQFADVTAIDFSEPMIARLQARAAVAGFRIDARVGDGMALPFEDGSFDVAFSMFGLIFFPDRAKGFRELARVLRPGGRAVVASWAPMDQIPLLGELFAGIREALPGLPFGEGKGPLGDAREFEAEMAGAGFQEVQVEEVSHAMEAPSLEELWASMRRSNVALVLLREKLGEEAWGAMDRAVLERLRGRFGSGPQRVEMIANLGLGIR